MNLSERLYALRLAAGLSLDDLSRRVALTFPDFSPSDLYAWENGHRAPSPAAIRALSQGLGVSPDLLTGRREAAVLALTLAVSPSDIVAGLEPYGLARADLAAACGSVLPWQPGTDDVGALGTLRGLILTLAQYLTATGVRAYLIRPGSPAPVSLITAGDLDGFAARVSSFVADLSATTR